MMQDTSVDNVMSDSAFTGAHDTSTQHLKPMPAAVASPPRRLEPVERRSSNVIIPAYSVEQWTVSQFARRK